MIVRLTGANLLSAGCEAEFEVLVLNDMGYTNAHGTKEYLRRHAQEGAAFAWHGGDISCACSPEDFPHDVSAAISTPLRTRLTVYGPILTLLLVALQMPMTGMRGSCRHV